MKLAFAQGANARFTATNGRATTPATGGRVATTFAHILFTLLLLLNAQLAFAGANLFRGNNMSAPQGGTDTMTVNYIPDGVTTSYTVDLTYDSSIFQVTPTPSSPATCVVVAPGLIRISRSDVGNPQVSEFTLCNIQFRASPAATPMSYPTPLVNEQCFDDSMTNTGCASLGSYTFTVSPAGNGPSCPVIKINGDNQTGDTNTQLSQPLQVKQAFFAPTPPGSENFMWTITSGDATFQSTGTQNATDTVPYVLQSGNLYDAFAAQTIVLGPTAGPVTIEAQSTSCQPQGNPAMFNATAQAVAAPTLSEVSGSGQSAPAGSTLAPFVVALDNGGPAIGVPVTFTITTGNATFTESGANTHTVASDGTGKAQATPQINPTALAGTGVVVRISAPGGYSDLFMSAQVINPPTMTKISGDGQSGNFGDTLAPMVVELDDGTSAGRAATPDVLAPGVGVTYTIVSGDATFVENGATTHTTVTDGSGRAQSTLKLGTTTPGNVQVDVTATGYPTQTFTATILAPPVKTMTIVSGDNQSGNANATLAPMIVELLIDGSPPSTTAVQFQILSGDATFAENGAIVHTPSTDGSGRAQSTLQLGTTPGNITVEVTASGFPTTQFTATLIAPGTPAMNKVSGDDQFGRPGDTLAPMVIVIDDGATPATPVVGQSVTYTISGDAVFAENGGTSYTTVTDANGNAQASLTLGSTAEQLSVLVTSPGYNSVTFNAQNGGIFISGGITVTSGDGQTTRSNTEFPNPLVVQLAFDSIPQRTPQGGRFCQNPPAGEQVVFTLTGPAVFIDTNSSSTTVISDANGQAAVRLRATSGSGSVDVEINSTTQNCGTLRPATAQLFVEEPTRELTKFSGDQQVGVPGSRGQDLVVRATESGDPLENLQIDWRVVAVLSGPGITLDGTTSRTDSDGKASMGFTFGDDPTQVIVEAREPSGIAVQFVVSAGQGAELQLVSGSNGVTGGTTQLGFRLIGPDGQPIEGQTINFSVTGGNATLSATTATTDANGVGRVTLRYGSTPGQVSVRASAFNGNVVLDAVFTSFTSGLTIVSGNNQSGAPGTRLPNPLVVSLTQATVDRTGVPVTWQVLSGGGTVSSATTMTDTSGRASIDYTLGAQAGLNRVQASIPGASVVFDLTGTGPTGAVPAVLEIVSGNNQTLTTGQVSAPLLVRVSSATGVRVQNVCVNWDGSDGVVVSSIQTTTNSLGETSITAVLNQPGPATVEVTVPCAGAVPPVTFTLNGGVANIGGLDPDEAAVASAIDSACPALASDQSLTPEEQDLLAQCNAIAGNAGTQPGNVANVLEEILADESAAQDRAALDAATTQVRHLAGRLITIRSGSRGVNFDNLAIAAGNGVLPMSFLPSNIIQDEGDEGGAETEAGAEFSRWGFFASGTIGQGDRDPGESAPGFEFDTYGLTAGVDYRFSDSLVFGAALGYTDVDTDIDGGRGDLQTSGYSLSGYGTFYRGEWYTDAVVTLGRNNYDLSRRIRYTLGSTSVDQTATASPDGSLSSISLAFGRDFQRGAWSLGPYGRASYTKVDFDTYTERLSNPNAPGAGLAMTVEGRDLESLEAVFGGKASYTMSTSWGILIPHVQLEWLHEFEDDPQDVVSRFANDPTGTPIVVTSDPIDSNYFNLGFGLSGVFANGRSAFLYYERRAGQSDFSSDTLAIGVRIEF